jgi:hypothetical protein
MTPQATDRYRDWTSLFIELAGHPQHEEPMYLQRRAEDFWYTLLPDPETLYLKFNQVRERSSAGLSLIRTIEQVESDLANSSVQYMVLDLRNNPGGNVRASTPLTEWVRNEDEINQQDHLFVLIGRQTFSAATLFTVDLEQATQAIFGTSRRRDDLTSMRIRSRLSFPIRGFLSWSPRSTSKGAAPLMTVTGSLPIFPSCSPQPIISTGVIRRWKRFWKLSPQRRHKRPPGTAPRMKAPLPN